MDAVFIGSSEAAVGVLHELRTGGLLVKLIVSRPDRKAGRGRSYIATPVSKYARSVDAQLITPDSWKDGKALEDVRATEAPVIIVASYGRVLPTELLIIPEHGVLNIHPSILPAYRGPSPVVTALLEGVGATGVTVMELDEGLDTGPIVAQREVGIGATESGANLEKRLFGVGARLLLDILPGWVNGEVLSQKQEEGKATYTKRISKKDGRIDWNKPTVAIMNQIRAFDPWPSSYVVWDGNILKILEVMVGTNVDPRGSPQIPGEITRYYVSGRVFPSIKTSDGTLVLARMQREGRGVITGHEFLNGYPKFIGAYL
jgi:methionyl-tRNA formyltransferase